MKHGGEVLCDVISTRDTNTVISYYVDTNLCRIKYFLDDIIMLYQVMLNSFFNVNYKVSLTKMKIV